VLRWKSALRSDEREKRVEKRSKQIGFETSRQSRNEKEWGQTHDCAEDLEPEALPPDLPPVILSFGLRVGLG
jgi:hypothetical protein